MTTGSDRLRRSLPALVAFAFVLTTIPSFFAIYRGAAFNTAPHDDYAPLMLALTGELGARPTRQPTLLGTAPIGYRVLSVVPAIPFYHVLPYYPFTNLANRDEHYLRAVAALSLVSYLSILLTVLVIYLIARRRLGSSPGASLLTAFFSFGLFQFMALQGVDPQAVLVISLLIYFFDRPAVFVPVIIASAPINEKVAIVFALLFAGRFIAWSVRRRSAPLRYWPQMLGTGVAVLVYAAMRLVIFRLPGYENQTEPGTWLSGAWSTITLSLSLNGFVQNGIPLLVVAALLIVAYAAWRRHPPVFSPTDLAVAPALLVIGAMIDMQFTVGRLVMHSFPLYLPFLAFFFDDHFIGRRSTAAPSRSLEGDPSPRTELSRQDVKTSRRRSGASANRW